MAFPTYIYNMYRDGSGCVIASALTFLDVSIVIGRLIIIILRIFWDGICHC